MSQITDKLCQEENQEGAKSSLAIPLFIGLLVIMIAMFIGDTLFGKNSLEVYQALELEQANLDKKIEKLKQENAIIQKSYFTLQSVMPEGDDE